MKNEEPLLLVIADFVILGLVATVLVLVASVILAAIASALVSIVEAL